MTAMVLTELGEIRPGDDRLSLAQVSAGDPGHGEIRIRVHACGVCHTEIDEIEGRTAPPRLPVVPGHQIVGRVEALGEGVRDHALGDRVGVGWIYDACGSCIYCSTGRENLCGDFVATGRDVHGGYGEQVIVPGHSAFAVPDRFSDAEAAPLLCAGAVGYRSLAMAGVENGQSLGFFGFGSSAHLVLQMARHLYPDSPLGVITRTGQKQRWACELGADWAGPPEALASHESPMRTGGRIGYDAIIDTTPVWQSIVDGLNALAPGGRLVVNAIRKTSVDKGSLIGMEYPTHLWMEKRLTSVANVTYSDIKQALCLADSAQVKPMVELYQLHDANRALADLKAGTGRGAKVLEVQR